MITLYCFKTIFEGGVGETKDLRAQWALEEMGLGGTPELLVFNQSDRLAAGEAEAIATRAGGVAISALRGLGLRDLLEEVAKRS